MFRLLVLSAGFLVDDIGAGSADTLHIAAFNIRKFGKKKMSSRFNLNVITDVILRYGTVWNGTRYTPCCNGTDIFIFKMLIYCRYDLVFVQEIVDKSERAIYRLMKNVNEVYKERSGNRNAGYGVTLSKRVGREQYAYVYRDDKLRLISSRVYKDRRNLFIRDPYVAIFQVKTQFVPSFLEI